MILDLSAIARRARVAVLVAGLAWMFGLTPPPGTRIPTPRTRQPA